MAAPACSDAEFVRVWHEHGSPSVVAALIGVNIRNVYSRRDRLTARGYDLPTTSDFQAAVLPRAAYPLRRTAEVKDGVAVVFGDRHWWPGDGLSPAEAVLLALLLRLDPDILVANGDVLDGARQGKHAPMGWERKPSMVDELAAVQVGMRRIAEHAKRADKLRTVGNHDRRFDYHLSKTAPDYNGIRGMRLSDHLPEWPESWSIHINPSVAGGHTVIKHKIGSGVTAARTNAIKSGVHVVTNHTHRLDAHPITTYAGRHWGVQCGALADPRSPAFEYGEDQPDAGCAGFVVLTWRDWILQPPEMVEVDDAGVGWFRGEPVALRPRVRVKAG